MAKITILGSSSAVPDAAHENTHFAVQTNRRTILVDCPGSPIVRLEQAQIQPGSLTDIILTHFHPDHVGGLAPLLMGLWIIGRKNALNVYGLTTVIERAQQMMELYDWREWPGFYPVNFIGIAAQEFAPVIEAPEVRVQASPVKHLIPTIGLRFEFLLENRVLVYSSDTEPSDVVVRLARNSDILIHEATGASKGHTSPEQAGETAARAGARSLYLIHYPHKLVSPAMLTEKAKSTFTEEPVQAVEDFQIIEI